MSTEELKRLAEAATPGPWMYLLGDRFVYDRMNDGCRGNSIVGVDHAWAGNRNDLNYVAAANPAAVLELIAEIERVSKQRDELLEALKDAREMVSDWAGYASPYFQEKHDIDGDLEKLDAAIARMEG